MPKHSVVDRLESIVVHINSNSYKDILVEIFFLILSQWLNHFMVWGFLGKDMLQGCLIALSTIMVWVIVGTRLTFIQSAIMDLMLLE